ncbi:hypothetical protein [Pelotomaculum propionicicum]|uniref:Uncharacterized protein n=1 Tax=Pelotomaculum propionicicum TaxID=258475 RepID=A0A4Y7RR65_9FIRM|nr:hypothetical protein [Pelotomaculum propionicicum]TEB11266.1 hypothetical protein Pmgp_01801 [Pelotomaculum propionicicum]
MPGHGSEPQVMVKQNLKEDWIAALLELMKQLKQWTVEQIKIWEADPLQSIVPVVIESPVRRDEELLGRYFAPSLIITEENFHVEICPVKRFAIGPIGLVEMTNGERTYNLLYTIKKGWVILEDHRLLNNHKPLEKDLFLELLNQMFLKDVKGGEQLC